MKDNISQILKTLPALVLLLIGLSEMPANARRIKTKHSIPKQTAQSLSSESNDDSEFVSQTSDSIRFFDQILPNIRFYGFDKTVGSSFESFFIINGLDSVIDAMVVTITYFDMKGRQLHKNNVKIDCQIPPHQTLRTDIKSWDTQKSFYFHQSVKPKRQATPFDVKIELQGIRFGKEN